MTARILAIDDSPTICALVARALRGAGFTVSVASDGVEGVEMLASVAPDLIVTDLNMPRMDGFGLIDSVRNSENFSHVPILVLTTESSAELRARARASGATGWIVKPFNDQRLVSVISRVLGR